MGGDHPDDAAPVEARVRTWLETHGYPLEFRVAHQVECAGFDARQGVHVPDPSGKVREVDVVGVVARPIGARRAAFALVVECKSGRLNPYVVF